MKSFRSKFIALAISIGLLGVIAGPATPAHAFEVKACQKYIDSLNLGNSFTNGNFYEDFPTWRVYPHGKTINVAVSGQTCSEMSPPSVWIYLKKDKAVRFKMKTSSGPYSYPPAPTCSSSVGGATKVCGTWWFEIDPVLNEMPDGEYHFEHGGSVDGDDFVTPFVRTVRSNPGMDSFVLKKNGPTTTTVAPTQPNRPEVLDDHLDAIVWKPNRASVYYTVTVRCSPVCGTLPSNFSAKLCEVGTSFMSPTCIASSRPFQIGKAKKTKLGVVNTFRGTFIVEKKTTGRKYQAYLSIPAGKNHKTTLGLDTFVWNGKSSFKNVPSAITVPATTNGPTTTTSPVVTNDPVTSSTVAGVPTTPSVPATSASALSIVSDSISGKSSLTVQGSGAAFTLDVTMACSGTCTGLPASITGSMCKVGTSDADSSCTPKITLSQISGGSSRKATFRGKSNFGSTPTRFVYQPYFTVKAQGIADLMKLSGASRVTWAK